MKDNVFSSHQLATSVVPIKELAHITANTAVNVNSQTFFLNGTLPFDIAIVKLIKILVMII
jgi:hypothetical protein